MRLFPTDWEGFLDVLASWGELTIPARRAFLDGIAPGLSVRSRPTPIRPSRSCATRAFWRSKGGRVGSPWGKPTSLFIRS